MRVRMPDMPAPRTLSELRVRLLVDSLAPCVFPRATEGAMVEISAPDTALRLRLPAGWTLRPTSDAVVAIFDGPAESTIQVLRITRGAVGNQWLPADRRGTPAQGSQCEVARDSVGSIWTLYDAGAAYAGRDSAGRMVTKPSALANLITPAGLRYHFMIIANSERQRDELAGAVAASALRVSEPGP